MNRALLPLLIVSLTACGRTKNIAASPDTNDGGDAATIVDGAGDPIATLDGNNDLSPCPITDSFVRKAAKIEGPDAAGAYTTITAHATVTAVDDLASATPDGPPGKRFSFDGIDPPGRWVADVWITALPADLVSVGDIVDLSITAEIAMSFNRLSQDIDDIVISRDGRPIAFAANRAHLGAPILPALDTYGISLSDDGVICSSSPSAAQSLPCRIDAHRLRVAFGGDSATVDPGQTIHLGSLSLTVGSYVEFVDTGFCDAPSAVTLSGYVAP